MSTVKKERAKNKRIKAFMSTPEYQKVLKEEYNRAMVAVKVKQAKEALDKLKNLDNNQ